MALNNNFKKMRTYLVGAMDRVKDGGHGWRDDITPELEKMGITVLNPCKKTFSHIKEDDKTRRKIEHYKQSGQFEKIRKEYGSIRNADLRCVDLSDFIICNIDLNVHMCGSYEEIVTANRQKKPVLVWCKQGKSNVPNWLFFMLPHQEIFSTMNDLLDYLKFVNSCDDKTKMKRWFFLD